MCFFITDLFGVVAAAIQGSVDCEDHVSHLIVLPPLCASACALDRFPTSLHKAGHETCPLRKEWRESGQRARGKRRDATTQHQRAASTSFNCFRRVLRQLNGRTSTGARQATAALRPHASASFRSTASSTQKPPMCSLVSRYGPSVMSTLPSGCD